MFKHPLCYDLHHCSEKYKGAVGFGAKDGQERRGLDTLLRPSASTLPLSTEAKAAFPWRMETLCMGSRMGSHTFPCLRRTLAKTILPLPEHDSGKANSPRCTCRMTRVETLACKNLIRTRLRTSHLLRAPPSPTSKNK